MADKIIEQEEQHFGEFLDAVSAGLIGTPSMIAATILAMACLIHYCRSMSDSLPPPSFTNVYRSG